MIATHAPARPGLAWAAALSFIALAMSAAAHALVSAAKGVSIDPAAMARAFPKGGLVPAKAVEAQVIAARELATKTLGEDTRDLVFVPISPCTVWDTRFAKSPPFQGAIGDGVTREFYSHQDASGGDFTPAGGNPACTEANQSFLGGRPFAVMMTIYVNNPTGEGWLTFYRDGDPDPSQATISVFYAPGPTRTQTVISKSSRGYGTGAYDVAVTGRFATADASASVVGYFIKTTNNITLPPSTATTGNILKGANRFIHNYGAFNTFMGENAGNFSMTGANNTASGYAGLTSNTTGNYNTAGGVNALGYNTSGSSNTANGTSALYSNQGVSPTGGNNTASGAGAIYANFTGANNTANGRDALNLNADGNSNTASGAGALSGNNRGGNGGNSNTASGLQALYQNYTGNSNTASGDEALQNNHTGNNNTAIGMKALTAPPCTFVCGGPGDLHDGNIAVGYYAGSYQAYLPYAGFYAGGSYNVALGNAGVYTDVNMIRIGDSANHTRTFIAGVRGVTTGVNDSVALFIDSAGQLGTLNSSRRFKDDIADMGEASSALMKLRPVTFHYKSDQDPVGRQLQYGLIAEEVAQVYPGLVAHSADGQVETVMYQFLPAMLLNEYQKRQRAIEAQAAMARQESQHIAELDRDRKARLARIAELEEQAAKVAALDQDRKAQAAELAALKQLTAKMALALDRLQQNDTITTASQLK